MQPFGVDTSKGIDTAEQNEAAVTPEQRQYMAEVNGVRKLWQGYPNHTQFCMSNPKARTKIAEYVASYAENHTNSDYLHVWLADGRLNHCECAECVKRTPSDWYVMLLNEIDEKLTEKKLSTRIVYIAYTETIWAPETEKLKNPERFAMLFAPSSRRYSEPLRITCENPVITPYVRNKNTERKEIDQLFWHFKDWTREWHGANLSYEYHFWRHYVYDVAGISMSKILNKDIKFYGDNNIHGVIEDGSQRCFFPTGLAFYTYARTLYDSSLSFEEIAEDYFSTAFGEEWKKFYDYLERLNKAIPHAYLSGDMNLGTGRSELYNPAMVDSIKTVRGIVSEGRELINKYYNSDYRVRTVSVRLLEFHADYMEKLADILALKAVGKDGEAIKLFEVMCAECGARELEFERWYDHGLFFQFLHKKVTQTTLMSPLDIERID